MAKLSKRKIPFTQVANDALNDKDLSWKAKGLFAYLFSKPENWDFSGERMIKDGSDGKKVIYSALKELEINGYLIRKKLGNGRVEYYLKYTDPIIEKGEQDGVNPVLQNGKLPKGQLAEMGNISNTDKESNKEEESNKDSNGQAVAEILHCFESVNPAIKRMYGNITQRGAVTRLITRFGFENTVKGANAAIACLGQPFAPRITTPYELEMSWAKLVAFYQENQNKKFSKGKNIIGL